ncbi:MAG: hypothetical protein R2708_28830 [Vicinamibacterales bacterium]
MTSANALPSRSRKNNANSITSRLPTIETTSASSEPAPPTRNVPAERAPWAISVIGSGGSGTGTRSLTRAQKFRICAGVVADSPFTKSIAAGNLLGDHGGQEHRR